MSSPIATLPGIQKLIQRELASGKPLIATLATVRPDATAAARSVVLRGFDAENDSLWMSTHGRAGKSADLHKNPSGEIVIWLPHRKIQLRLRATWRVIDSMITARMPALAELRQLAWNTHSTPSKRLFLQRDPGQPDDPRTRRSISRALLDSDPPDLDTPPPSFTVLLGTLERIDALRLTEPLHERFLHEKLRSTWRTTAITP